MTILNGNLHPIDLHDLIDPRTNRIAVRTVNIESDTYEVARAFMIRLEISDLEDPVMLNKLAAEAGLSPKEFKRRYIRAASRLGHDLPPTPHKDKEPAIHSNGNQETRKSPAPRKADPHKPEAKKQAVKK